MNNLLLSLMFLAYLPFERNLSNSFIWENLNDAKLIKVNGKNSKPLINCNTVFIFLSPECPLCKNYIPVLNKLKIEFPNVNIVGLVPGNSYSVADVNQFSNDYKVNFDLYIDKQKKATKILKAKTTPEVFLLDNKGNIRYRGLIDNWAVNLGVQRKITTLHFLKDALTGLSMNQFQYKETIAIGCLINDL